MSNKVFTGGEYLKSQIDCNDVFTPEDYTDEHRQIGETTEQFVLNEVQPVNDEIEAKNFDVMLELFRKSGELGLLMVDTPEEYDGLELDKVTSMLVCEKFGFAGSFGVTALAHTGIGMLPLIYYGTADQKQRYLGKLSTGEWVASYCLTEPGSGSDALGAKTSAILSEDGSHYLLNGTKQFITSSAFANMFTVVAQVDKQHFTGFLVERSFAGLDFGPEEKKMGMKGTSTRQVILNDVKVPVENLLGEVGKGHKIAFNVLNVGRLKLGPICTGQIKYALSEGARYANARKQFNLPISSFGAIKQKLADVTADCFAVESTTYRVASMIDDRLATIDKSSDEYYAEYLKGIEEYAAECAIIKVFSTEMASDAIDEMLQVHGGYGYISEYPIEQLYRDERVQRIWEGTNEVNRLLIPGIFMRKGMTAASAPDAEVAGNYQTEKRLLNVMKRIYLELADSVIATFGAKAANEQEILLALADVAIQIFALESAVLRADKAEGSATESKKALYQAVVKVCTFSARQKFLNAAEQCAVFVENDSLLESINTDTAYPVSGLLAAKRLLADATSETEKYIF